MEEKDYDTIDIAVGKNHDNLYDKHPLKEYVDKKLSNELIGDKIFQFGGFTFKLDNKSTVIHGNDENDFSYEIQNPKDICFNGKSCNAEGVKSIKLSKKFNYLKFDDFTFTKKSYSSVDKTIFDEIVEKHVPDLIGYKELYEDGCYHALSTYSFPLYYNRNGVFTIPAKISDGQNGEEIRIIHNNKTTTHYPIDKQSAIYFKNKDHTKDAQANALSYSEGNLQNNNISKFEYIEIDVKNNNNGKRQRLDITNAEAKDLKRHNLFNDNEDTIENDNNCWKMCCCCFPHISKEEEKENINTKQLNNNLRIINGSHAHQGFTKQ